MHIFTQTYSLQEDLQFNILALNLTSERKIYNSEMIVIWYIFGLHTISLVPSCGLPAILSLLKLELQLRVVHTI